jgi:hypothetical protein
VIGSYARKGGIWQEENNPVRGFEIIDLFLAQNLSKKAALSPRAKNGLVRLGQS